MSTSLKNSGGKELEEKQLKLQAAEGLWPTPVL